MKKINLLTIISSIIIFGIVETASAGLPNSILTQRHYRWRSDDGSETSATWKAPEDTMAFANTNENIRLRFAVDNTGNLPGIHTYELQYCAGDTNGPWTSVLATPGVQPFVMSESPNFVNLEPTTDQLNGVGSFDATGSCVEHPSNSLLNCMVDIDKYINLEFCFQATENAWGSTNYFKLSPVGIIPSDGYAKLIIGVPEPAFIIFTLFLIIWLKQKFKP